MSVVKIYTDGSSNAKTGFGGWGYHFTTGEERIKRWGGATGTTNNQMELTAVIEALKDAKSRWGCSKPLVVFSDSQYVVKGITTWIYSWVERGWRTADGKPVKNKDFWIELHQLAFEMGNVHFHWVKGHAGFPENELADELAGRGRKQVEKEWKEKDSKSPSKP